MIKFHPSSLGRIMTEPKSKTEVLSVGAKTYLGGLAKEFIYSYTKTISSKFLDKGIIVEDEAIELYNSVFFTSYTKNTERRENEWLTGECDIFTGKKIIDIKSSWSLDTFPATAEDGKDSDYEWQVRAYMMLWDVDEAEIAYCLVNTPDELIGFEQEDLHYVDHIDPQMRITRVFYQRDMELEEKIKFKADAAKKYLQWLTQKIISEHNG